MGSWQACHEFEPCTTKDSPCRGELHVKSVENSTSSRWCGVVARRGDVRFSLQSDSRQTLIWRAPGTRYHQENTIERHRYGGAGWLVWAGIILGSRTDLHVQSVMMKGYIYRDVILEQHEDIPLMDWPAYSPGLNPIEHVWHMLGRRITPLQPPPTGLHELRRALLDE
ncbi:HTH_Tnp_Tc3_2 domain-containing protein [Trichonephila clavipes]|nr:HTH_Tnp_Tc3_2 domain-containing protein [Trichonephila clavipes]